jgi:leucyl aminopeptidase
MEIEFKSEAKADVVAVLAAEGGALGPSAQALEAKTSGAISRAIAAAGRFTGGAGQVLEILAPPGLDAGRLLVIGVGGAEKFDAAGAERFAGYALKRVLTSGAETLAIHADALGGLPAAEAAARAALGVGLASYRFDKYRTKLKPEAQPSIKEVTIVTEGPAAAKARYAPHASIVEGVHLARDLVSEPANILHPEEFAKRCQALAAAGLEIEVLGEEEMTKLGMNALLGVGRGSRRESQLVVMKWMGAKNKGAQPLALVGKGVTFDTGGISLKPGPGMEDMKGDMGGAAAVTGAMLAIAKRKAKANVVGLIGLVENMPDGDAQRPGDIVTSMSGQTIEVLNTDAEGRLVLSDVVWYAQEKLNPAAVVDLATLTGAIVIALGHDHAGLFCNNDALATDIVAAGQAEGEPVWRMPLGPSYDKMMDTPNADIKNISGKPTAGSITGAQFIQRFIKEATPWAHLDIAGTAWRPGPHDDPTSPVWATGWGVRILNRLVSQRYEE